MTAEHALVVKTHWKDQAARLREQLQTSHQEAAKQVAQAENLEARDVFAIRAGIEAFVARAALGLLDEVLAAAEDAEGALPIRLQLGQFLLLDGKVENVTYRWQQTEPEDAEQRWGIITEAQR